MPTKQTSNVDAWLKRETLRTRKALESASRHFDADDGLTVNTLEAIYGQESSFGTQLGTRGSSKPAGHFQFEPPTTKCMAISIATDLMTPRQLWPKAKAAPAISSNLRS